ncbi:MAG: hypothetical protein ABIA47_03420 [bacterium]
MEKEAKTLDNEQEFEEIDVGESLVSWETWEFPPHERSRLWYIATVVVGIGLLIYAIASANYLFAIIILMMGVIVMISGLRHPDQVIVHITDQGVVLGDEFFSYDEIKDFSIVYSPPEVKLLYVDFVSMLKPMLTIPLEDANPNVIRDALLQYSFENLERESETVSDLFRRLYKF